MHGEEFLSQAWWAGVGCGGIPMVLSEARGGLTCSFTRSVFWPVVRGRGIGIWNQGLGWGSELGTGIGDWNGDGNGDWNGDRDRDRDRDRNRISEIGSRK